jgi:hypothetical protein
MKQNDGKINRHPAAPRLLPSLEISIGQSVRYIV